MKRLFFTLLSLCLFGTMWADTTGTDIQKDVATGLYFATVTYDNATTNDVIAIIPAQSGDTYSVGNLVKNDDGTYTLPATVQADGGEAVAVQGVAASAFASALTDTNNPIHLVIPANIVDMGQSAFQNCTQIEEVTVEYSEVDLDEAHNTTYGNSFSGCSNLKVVTQNRNITIHRNNAQYTYICFPFADLPSIETVYIGEKVTSLANNAYNARSTNTKLTKVYCYATAVPSLAYQCFLYQADGCTLYVYDDLVDTFKSDSHYNSDYNLYYGWGDIFTNIVGMGEEPDEEQPEGTLRDVATGLYFEIADGVTSIVADASGTYTDDNLVKNDDGSYTLPSYVEDKSGTNGNVTRIDESAFYSSHISGHLFIPAHILRIGKSAFKGCTGLTEVTYEYSATALEDENGDATANYSFEGCTGVTTVNLNRDVNLGSGSRLCAPFCYTTSITKVIVGENVTVIPSYMFRNTGNACLTEVYCYPTSVPTTTYDPFSNLPSTGCTLYVPAGCKDLYADAQYAGRTYDSTTWGEFFSGNIVEMESVLEEGTYLDKETGLYFEINEDGTASIYHDELGVYDNNNLVGSSTITGAYTFPETVSADGETYYDVTRIEANAFANSGISGHLVVPANILYMGEGAFYGCTGLTEVTYEYSATALNEEYATNNGGNYSFGGCTNVTTVNLYRDITLPHSKYIIGPFCATYAIKTLNIGPRVTALGDYLFHYSFSTSTTPVINCYAPVPFQLGYYSFDTGNNYTFYAPNGAATAYSTLEAASSNHTAWNQSGTFTDMTDAFAITTHDNNEGTAYGTFYNSASDVALFDDGSDTALTAYSAYTLDNETNGLYIEIEEIGNSVPAATGVIVETEKVGTYLAIATGETTTFSGNNNLYGYDEATTIGTPSGDYYYYLLSSNEDGQVGFYWGEENGAAFECQAHKAYLALSQSAVDDSNGIFIRKGNGGGDTTGISSVEDAVEGATVKGIYTLQGVRVSDMSQKGVYIVDGKKVLVK